MDRGKNTICEVSVACVKLLS